MREIKFRAWDKVDGSWFEPHTFKGTKINDAIRDFYGENDSFVLMQYTGLKDKSGKEIYEGDILKDMLGNHHEVAWSEELGDAGATYGVGFNAYDGDEVAGNKWENPELLTREE